MINLLSPINIKGVQLKNRMVMPPMASYLAREDGELTKELEDYYIQRGDVGLIIIEHSYISPEGRVKNRQTRIDREVDIDNLLKLTEAIHQQSEAKVGIQITHAGGAADSNVIGQLPLGPSAIKVPRGVEIPGELTEKDIKRLIECFASAAIRAKKAGFDLVEIHGAHGYLLCQFLSPFSNKRTDKYGGSKENRLRFPLEVVKAVREAVGLDYPLFYRLGADDRISGGLTVEEAAWAAPQLVAAGVDAIDLSGGHCGYLAHDIDGFFNYLAEAIKPTVSVPVMITGGIKDPLYANSIVVEGKADLVGVGRSLLKNPNWAKKAKNIL
ncbi:MAG: NADH:flavin oxidoreductase [Bacillota bacterium]|nr:NADH:flavin oxidoreductase [Bacillota bacterium]